MSNLARDQEPSRTRALSKKDLVAIQEDLVTYDQVREQVLSLSRTAVRVAGSSILEIHRGNLEAAASGIEETSRVLRQITEAAERQEELLNSSSVLVAQQEFVEANTLYQFVQKGRIPSLAESGSEHRGYMLGLLDAIGEFRRMALNGLRKGKVERAEELLDVMEGIYEDLQGLEHTSIIPTFRVKMDVARKIIESTRGDVVTEVRRYSLEQALDRVGSKLSLKPARQQRAK